MKTSQISASLGFGSLMFIAGHYTGVTQGGTWVLFTVCTLAFVCTLIAGWAE